MGILPYADGTTRSYPISRENQQSVNAKCDTYPDSWSRDASAQQVWKCVRGTHLNRQEGCAPFLHDEHVLAFAK